MATFFAEASNQNALVVERHDQCILFLLLGKGWCWGSGVLGLWGSAQMRRCFLFLLCLLAGGVQSVEAHLFHSGT